MVISYINWGCVRKRYLRFLLSSLLFALFFSCKENKMESVLKMAGDNAKELEMILRHYENDEEKYNAALFLIHNMPDYYSLVGEELDKFKMALGSADSCGVLDSITYNKWIHFSPHLLKKSFDIRTVSADYLIKNIDLAFTAWKKRPWAKSISFDEFCNFILPYRINDEVMDNWREIYYNRYSFLLDSVYTGNDIVKAVKTICEYIQKEDPYRFTWVFDYPHLGGEYLLNNRVGKCKDACDFIVYVLRALGIPVACDYYAYNSETRNSHIWNVIKDSNGKWLPFAFPYTVPQRGNLYIDSRRPSVIYRQYFGKQNKDKGLYIPQNLIHEHSKKVSDNYFSTTLRIETKKYDIGDCALLGLFNNHGWIPIDYAMNKNGIAIFKNIGPNQIYILMDYSNGQSIAKGYPFYFDGNNIQEFIPTEERISAKITRKFPLSERVIKYMNDMRNGTIWGNNGNNKANLLYKISDSITSNHNIINLKRPVNYRYIHYISSSESYAQVAELHIFYNNKEHCPTNWYGEEPATQGTYANQVSDNNPLSYYISKKRGAKITIDLGQRVTINRLTFMPRNDDNFVNIDTNYELFYWSKEGWTSLGRQTAKSPQLLYNNIPMGSLLYLHNCDGGEEELAFYIKDGRQVFVSDCKD